MALNDTIMVFAFAPIVALLLGLSSITVPWTTLFLSVVLYIVVPVIAAQLWRRSLLARGGDAALAHILRKLQPVSLVALLATLVLLFGFQGEQIIKQPLVIALGPWMDWLRRALGLTLLGTAVWLLSVLVTESGLWSALATGTALLALLILVMARAVSRFGRYGGRAIGVAAIVLSVVALLVPSLNGRAVPIEAPSGIAQAGLWRPYDVAALRELVAGGQVVFVDVSAAWCHLQGQ